MSPRRLGVCTTSLGWGADLDEPAPESDEAPERLIPAVPDPPRLRYERPVVKEAPLRGLRGVRVNAADAREMGQGWSIASALVSSLIAGVLLGLAADRWWIKSSTPWGLIVGFVLGSISGFANLFQQAARMERESRKP